MLMLNHISYIIRLMYCHFSRYVAVFAAFSVYIISLISLLLVVRKCVMHAVMVCLLFVQI